MEGHWRGSLLRRCSMQARVRATARGKRGPKAASLTVSRPTPCTATGWRRTRRESLLSHARRRARSRSREEGCGGRHDRESPSGANLLLTLAQQDGEVVARLGVLRCQGQHVAQGPLGGAPVTPLLKQDVRADHPRL